VKGVLHAKVTAIAFVCVLFLAGSSHAERATSLEAERVCENWITHIVSEKGSWAGSLNPHVRSVQELTYGDTLLARVYSIDPAGYVVVPVLKELPPIKASSERHDLDVNDTGGMAQLLRDVLISRVRTYAAAYGSLDAPQPLAGPVVFGRDHREQWSRFSRDAALFKTNPIDNYSPLTEVGPLLTSEWHQGAPYNNLCPMGDGGRTVVGCVATAASQIMRYWEWPVTGAGSHSYYWDGDQSCGGDVGGGSLYASFSDEYDWANMPDDCGGGCTQDQRNALAELSSEVGIAFDMDYGVCGSGSWVYLTLDVFPDYFRYDGQAINGVDRLDYSYGGWFDVIKAEINLGRPIHYRITGHAIVCDGWRDTGGISQYHMNYGWGGPNSAWYTIDNIYGSAGPGDEYIVRGIRPLADWYDVATPDLQDPQVGRGAAWGDYDGDGDVDLYVSNDGGPNKLFQNDGGVLTDVTASPLDDSGNGRGVVWGDYDGDGDLDLYLVNNGANKLFRNDGGGSFTDVTSSPLGDTGAGGGVAWVDYDLDNDLDLYLANYGSSNKLFRNDGGGAFTDVTASPLNDAGNGTSVAWADYDNDGDLDLYLANYGSANKLIRNDGGGAFTDATASPLNDAGNGTSVAWADYDNDGDLDLYLVNDGAANKLFRNDGGSTFTDVTAGALADAGAGRGAAWADYDNDGDVDLYVANEGSDNRLLRNDGGAVFTDTTPALLVESGNSRAVSWADIDLDGDAELLVVSDGTNRLFENDLDNGNHWFEARMIGVVSNTSAIGTRVRIVAGGTSQIREVFGGSGYHSQNSLPVEFGLGAATVVDTVEVEWPSGTSKTYVNLPADSVYTLYEFHPPLVAVAVPNGGEVWGQGSHRLIQWTNTGGEALEYSIEYSDNAGADWDSVYAATGTGSGSYMWKVAATPTTQALVRVTMTNLDGTDSDTSDAVFTILPTPITTVLSPNGGEMWEFGDAEVIRWSNTGGAATSYTVQFSDDSGSTWTAIADSIPGAGPDSLEWIIPEVPTLTGWIRVILENDDGISKDTSDGYFSLAPPDDPSTEFSIVATGPQSDSLFGRGAAWGDYDGDGDEDLYLANSDGPNRLFRNDGGSFVDAGDDTVAAGSQSYGTAFADYDNDSDLDIYLVNGGANKLYTNQGGTFTSVTPSPLGHTGLGRSCAWGDYDNDGDVDLYVVNQYAMNALFRNDGGGAFTNVTVSPLGVGGNQWGAGWADYDNDGDVDLYVARSDVNKLLRNDGGTFTDATSGPEGDAGHGRGLAWGDYDNDGDLDLYLSNDGANKLLRNDGGTFTDVTTTTLGDVGEGYGAAWADYDNDGDLDLYIASRQWNRLYRNDGGTFVDAANDELRDGSYGQGVSWADPDGDGDLDLYLTNRGANRFFRNDLSTGAHWIHVHAKGTSLNNRAAIGARVRIVAGGASQIREVSGGGGFLGQNSLIAAFGLGSTSSVDTIEVRWPSGLIQTVESVSADTLIDVIEPSPDWLDVTSGPLGDAGVGRGVAWGDYDGDGDEELYISNLGGANKLLRNDGSAVFTDVTAGPLGDTGDAGGSYWGDYDNDGDLDLYIVNAGMANKLLRNDGGTYTDTTSGPLGDTGHGFAGAWVDYDNDGDIDLYVANTGNANKLLRNDGADTFTDATPAVLADPGFAYSVAWADYDNDGDLDVYLGNAYSANKLIRNDGGGTFTDVTSGPLGDMGAPQGLSWGDYDNDGDLDLFIANGGGANKLFRNDGGGAFTDVTSGPLAEVASSYGCGWADADHDGDLDLLVAQSGANRLLRNDGGGVFVNDTESDLEDAATGAGMAWGDYDDDGRLDIYFANSTGANSLFRNQLVTGNHWIHVHLEGTTSNRSAIGARVRVVAGGVSQIREIDGGSGCHSQNSLAAEFGLGSATVVDTVEVIWPSGIVQSVATVAADQFMLLVESDPTGVAEGDGVPSTFALYGNAPNPFNPVTTIRFGLPDWSRVVLDVYDLRGRRIAVLADEVRDAGYFDVIWDGKDDRGRSVASGVYFVRMVSSDFTATQKMILIR